MMTIAVCVLAPALLPPASSLAADTTHGDRSSEVHAATEYEVSVHDGIHQAPNREHRFRTQFLESGIALVAGGEVELPWTWGLTWTGYGRGDAKQPVPPATLGATGNRMEYRRGRLLEWYENTPKGLKQSFQLEAPPERGSGVLHLDLALTGDLSPSFSEDGQAIDFTRSNVAVLRYDRLIVTDARGSSLPARMEGFVRGIRIAIDDSDAVYPITVDPLVSSPAWIHEIDQASAFFGVSGGTAGDVNGDGYSDLIVGASANAGTAFVFHGSASGLGATEAWKVEGMGGQVSTAGDVDGDGYADVIVGDSGYDAPGSFDDGRAFVYLGTPSGLSTTPAWTVTGELLGTNLGIQVATAGDVNGDGYSDVLVCSIGLILFDGGRAQVYHGSAAGLSTSPSWTALGDHSGARFCASGGTAGDVNGDGYGDLVIGEPGASRAFVYLGSAAGLATSAAWAVDSVGADFGGSVGAAGDVNGDGYADIVIGASGYSNGQTSEGGAFVYYGSSTGVSTMAAWSTEGNQNGAGYGAVATAGDVDGDGYADLLVGASRYDNGQFDEGQVFLYRGSSGGLAATPAWTFQSDQESAYMGGGVTAGDVNGDGLSDLLVGDAFYDGPTLDEGRIWVFLGRTSTMVTTPAWTTDGNQVNAQYGDAVETAGDVNGDGYADFLIGAAGATDTDGNVGAGRAFLFLGAASGPSTTPSWTAEGGQEGASFGFGLSGAGDVNGDGYDDVIVGAAWYDGGEVDEGRALLYLGSPAGLAGTPAWSTESNQADAQYGIRVAGAGDVNGDGYADVAVGAYRYDGDLDGEGRAYVYLGSASGLSTTPAWIGEGDQADANYGVSVATAGDVNADGYSDLVVGAWTHSGGEEAEGRAYLYLGSATGLSTTPAWIGEPNLVGAFFGTTVRSAGDVNGDGYADVLVGAAQLDIGLGGDTRGSAFLYLGSSTGLSATPAWTAQGTAGGSLFGYFLSGAGDVNGDGFADIAISAWGQGRASLWFGSASGPGSPLFPDWTASAAASTEFGYEIGAAGDVNGDGFADLLVGARGLDDGQTDEGRAYLYYGNGERALPLAPRQCTSDDFLPVAHLGASDESDAFRLKAFARTAFGRGKVRLEVEVKPLGAPLNGNGTAQSSAFDTGTAGALVSTLVEGLEESTLYHWRARVRHDAVTSPLAPPNGRWVTMPWGGWNESMLRTFTPLIVGAGRASGLRLRKSTGSLLQADWSGGGSCVTSDDHALYEGTLGDFTSHAPVTCSTSHGAQVTFEPSSGNRYYLLVPINGTREGSYGLDGDGVERPASTSACAPQEIATCE
jgi:hypothetical protein